jgi:tRNA-splicing ligase RtcB
MSFKYQAVLHSPNHYVLPKVGNMKVEAHAFLSEELYAASEEQLWKQIADGASYEGVIGAYLMPDCHTGYGIPVGGVIVTDNTIIQAGSGYDISCGVLYIKADLNAGSVKGKYARERWVTEIEKRVATGVGSQRPKLMPEYAQKTVDDVLLYGAKALGIDASLCERQYIPIPETLNVREIPRAYSKAQGQLGSLGGGNHFCELQVDEADGTVWAMVHCGSRGYGRQTAEHFFYEAAKVRGLSPKRRESSWVRLDEEVGRRYWAFHNTAANYAIANRLVIAEGVKEAFREVFNTEAEVYFDISHNLVQEETLVFPDGTTRRGFVHRKGATRAFPAWHPDLQGSRWEKTGHPVLIPGSMYDGAAILFPGPEAYQSACSVNHGSGRSMARNDAKRKLEHKQLRIDDEMATVQRTFGGVPIEGIVTNHKHVPLDECRYVYKDLGAVLQVLTETNIARVERRLWPVANIKGTD